MRAVFIALFFSLLCGRAGGHFTNGAAVALTSVVRGTMLPLAAGNLMVGDPSAVAVADATVTVVVPPVVENLHYDMAGRLADDGFWTYRWDGASRLIGMTRKAVASAQPTAVTTLESVNFGYDADGRRTSKSRLRLTKTAGTNGSTGKIVANSTEMSKVL